MATLTLLLRNPSAFTRFSSAGLTVSVAIDCFLLDFRAYIREAGLETGGTGSLVRPVVACKGTTCQYGLLDSFGIAEDIQ